MSRMNGFAIGALVAALTVVILSASFLMYNTLTSKSEAEKQAEFVERYKSLPSKSEAEKQADFMKRYNSLEAEKQAEARKRAEDINSKVLNSARPVSVDLVYKTTLKQLFLDTGVDEIINAKRAEAQLAPITIDEIYNDFQEEAVSEIPQYILDVTEIFADGNVKVHLSSTLQAGPMSLGWFMGKDLVGLPPYAYFEICNSLVGDEFTATFTMHADIGSEDTWKKEVLFDGTVRQLCLNDGSYPKFYENQGIVVFKRPATKSLPIPAENSIVLGSADELEEDGKLYYPRVTENGMKVEIGFFEGVKKFNEVEIIEFRGALDPSIDAGAPVYYISEDKNPQIRLVGFIIPSENTSAVSAEFVLTGVEEIQLVER